MTGTGGARQHPEDWTSSKIGVCSADLPTYRNFLHATPFFFFFFFFFLKKFFGYGTARYGTVPTD